MTTSGGVNPLHLGWTSSRQAPARRPGAWQSVVLTDSHILQGWRCYRDRRDATRLLALDLQRQREGDDGQIEVWAATLLTYSIQGFSVDLPAGGWASHALTATLSAQLPLALSEVLRRAPLLIWHILQEADLLPALPLLASGLERDMAGRLAAILGHTPGDAW